MSGRGAYRTGPGSAPVFSMHATLVDAGRAATVEYGRGETVFMQGDACADVMYIQTGGVTLSVRPRTGRDAVVAILGPGEFFGEGCLAGQTVRTSTATAITRCTVLLVGKHKMARLLHERRAMSDRFISHLLSRNIRIEEDLLDRKTGTHK